jgi:hypothetical protein
VKKGTGYSFFNVLTWPLHNVAVEIKEELNQSRDPNSIPSHSKFDTSFLKSKSEKVKISF